MNTVKALDDIFNILHDGTMESIAVAGNDVELKISVQYLAELIDESYEYIHLKLNGVEKFKFQDWNGSRSVDLTKGLPFDIEIMDSTIDNNEVVVMAQCLDFEDDELNGGEIRLRCSGYRLFDEEMNEFMLPKLKELSTYYWNEKFK